MDGLFAERTMKIVKKTKGTGFTLIELLVSMAVMGLVLALVGQIVSSVLQTTQVSQQRLDAAARARAVMQAIGKDLDALVAEQGLSVFIKQNAGGNMEMAFLTRGRPPTSPGTPGDSRFLAVDYQLDGQDLERKFTTVNWTDYDLLTGAVSGSKANNASVLARGVLKFSIVAVLDNGEIQTVSTSSPGLSGTVNGQDIPESFYAVNLKGNAGSARYVRALIVGVATVDEQSVKLLGSKFSNLSSALATPNNGEVPIDVWKKNIDQLGAGYPSRALAAIHLAQNTFVLK